MGIPERVLFDVGYSVFRGWVVLVGLDGDLIDDLHHNSLSKPICLINLCRGPSTEVSPSFRSPLRVTVLRLRNRCLAGR